MGYHVIPIEERNSMFYEKIVELEKALSLDYLTQVITIRGKDYVFGPPTTPQEKKQQAKQRKKVITLLIEDAARESARCELKFFYNSSGPDQDGIVRSKSEVPYEVWDTIDAILNNIPSREECASPIDPESIEQLKIEAQQKKQVGLDYSSYQVQMQDPSIDDVEGWDIDDN
jgi:hypothetical protein